MKANVAVFIYHSKRTPGRVYRIPKPFLSPRDQARVAKETEAIFGPPDRVSVQMDVEMSEEALKDILDSSGKDAKKDLSP